MLLTVTSGELGPVTLTASPEATAEPVPLVKPCPSSQTVQVAGVVVLAQEAVWAPDLET